MKDTSFEMEEKVREIIRRKTHEERLEMASSLTNLRPSFPVGLQSEKSGHISVNVFMKRYTGSLSLLLF